MASRLYLHEKLCDLLESRNVYFQPPSKVSMEYPAIRYSLSDPNQRYANDSNYHKTNKYEGVIIDYDPDSDIANKLLAHFPMCRLGKPYPADNLNHFPFTLYY